ncbi:LPS-assembly protein [Roseibium hamelinense]|uniref:LPS-assembly protein LptD n=1 Tax=Roseibium hamelinense TaxID=150831 RepID=A0A562TJJ4_9HYPH|nr:LPS-assembly protein LptD [Roseibium hamelinense]MTI42315.1 LPS-assembly protein LptD [Roseibium hamelinense]TWI93236.1 LPS-assembly protein [Roseibium hamelinense]
MTGSRNLLSTTALTRADNSKRRIGYAVVAAASFCLVLASPVQAQDNSLQNALAGQVDPNADLLLESSRIIYDFDRDIITAVGDVQVFYDGITVQAEQIVFNRRQDQLTAQGNVILIEPGGNVVRTSTLTLSEDLKNGFAQALRLDTPQRTRFIAEEATRQDGNVTTFKNGLYTVYTKPTTPPDKPPLWRIKAATIVHDQQEKTIYYEDASLEFFGTPIAYVPYFSMPDPTVKRKSGFLIPSGVASTNLGFGASIPYYWALSPYYDLTTTLTPLSEQGVVGDAAFRQRLSSGQYTLAAAGLFQAQPSKFAGTSGDQRWRGAVKTTGSFDIAENWTLGWDATYKSDRVFLKDYSFVSFSDNNETSEIYLEGNTLRNSLAIRGYAFSISQEDYTTDGQFDAPGFSPVGSDLQDKQPFVAPVVDYNYVFDDPVAGGELSFTGNFTSLTRAETDAFNINGTDRFRGVDGTFSRVSMKGDWRRTFIDPLGQTFTPFAYMRGDLFFIASADEDVSALAGESFVGRAMPAAGLEYRYPFVATFAGGNQILEPVAQVIVRPDEQRIGELPNDDAQSIVFDSTTLFDYDKFSGFDRAEGGSRLNVGFNYKLQLDEGYYLSALFGRSYQIGGENSYAKPDILGATLDSGLASDASDYVSSLYFDMRQGARLGAQARFDDDDFSVNRLQAQATAAYGPVVSTVAYAFLNAQPDVGIDDPREEILGAASLRLEENWRIFGSVRYDIENADIVQDGFGIGYDDEGFSLSVSYAEDRSRNDGDEVDRTLFLRIGLRTIGNTQVSSGSLD